ncbi:MAG: helix-turn-helix domain-containing protein [Bacilli bacterium]
MDHFQFTKIFANRRKELKLTQAQIAEYIGVSRAAVSKWEKGQSYPDITLLPKLAKLFHLSIDELLGYNSQMTKDEIRQTYIRLSKEFSKQPFELVEQEIEELLKEYYSCLPFVLKMAQLYLNYAPKSPDRQKTLNRVIQLCSQVKMFSKDFLLINEATMMEAVALLQLGKPEEVLELLGNDINHPVEANQLIATAHQMIGNSKKAKEIIQVSYYQNLVQLVSYATESMMMEMENGDYVEETVQKIHRLIQLFDLESLHFNTCLIFYYKAAAVFVLKGLQEQAMEMLQCYAKLCTKIKFPMKLQGNSYFYLVTDWIEKTSVIGGEAPRDEQSIKKDLVLTIWNDPIFAPLKEINEFKAMMLNLACHLKVEEVLK